jgi:hypothetical protein
MTTASRNMTENPETPDQGGNTQGHITEGELRLRTARKPSHPEDDG